MARRFIDAFRILNLDIALGACINMFMFSEILVLRLDLSIYILLFNTVWVIYTLDRIIDTRFRNFPDTKRHHFHRKNKRFLIRVIILVSAINSCLLIFIPWRLVWWGLAAGMLILLYLAMVRFFKGSFPKEFFTALFYTGGIVLAPSALANWLPFSVYTLYFIHFLLALSNLLIFSYYEQGLDKKAGQFNLMSRVPERWQETIISVVIFTALALTLLFSINYGFGLINFIFITMGALLLCVISFRNYFKFYDRYRFWADAAFLLPACTFLI